MTTCHDHDLGGRRAWMPSGPGSPPSSGTTTACRSPTSTAPGGTQVPQLGRRCDDRLPLHHNANTHWAYPDQRRDRRLLAAARGALADFLGASPVRDRLRRQHDDAHVPPRPRARAGAGPRATRSSSPSWTTTPTSTPGGRWRASGASSSRRCRFDAETGQLDMDDLARGDRPEDAARRDRRGVQRPRHDQRRAPRRAIWPTPPGRSSSSTPSTTRRTRWSTCGAGLRLPGLLGLQVLRAARRRAVGPAGPARRARPAEARARARRLAPSASRPARRTTRASSARRRPSISSPRSPRAGRAALASQAAFAALHARGQELARAALGGPAAISGVTVYGPPPGAAAHADGRRSPCSGVPSERVAARLAERAVFVSHGDFYATTVVERLGHAEDGVVRAGCACYTTAEEVDRLHRGRRASPVLSSWPNVGGREELTRCRERRSGMRDPSVVPGSVRRRARVPAGRRDAVADAAPAREPDRVHRVARGPAARRVPEARRGHEGAGAPARRGGRRHRRRLRLLRAALRDRPWATRAASTRSTSARTWSAT